MSERKDLRVSASSKNFVRLTDGNHVYEVETDNTRRRIFGVNQPVTAIVETSKDIYDLWGKASDVQIDLSRVPHLGEFQKGVFQYIHDSGQWAKIRSDPISNLGGIEFHVKTENINFSLTQELIGERISFWLKYNLGKDELYVDGVQTTPRQHTGLLVDSRGDYGFLSTHNQSRKVLLHKESCWPFDVEKNKHQKILPLLAGQVYDFDINESEKGLKAVSARLSKSAQMKWVGRVSSFEATGEKVLHPANSKYSVDLSYNGLESGTLVEYDLVPCDESTRSLTNISPVTSPGNLQGNIRHFNREKGFGFAELADGSRKIYDLFFNVRDVYPNNVSEKIGNGTRASAYSQHIISQEGKAQRAGILFLPDFLKQSG